MNVNQTKIGLKTHGILLLIFVLAMTLRVGLNVARQSVLFNKPFQVSSNEYDERVSSDSQWYVYAAKGFLNGKGLLSMEKRIQPFRGGQDNVFAGYVDQIEIDDKYYVHKIVPPLYPLFLAFCYAIGGFNILAYFIPQLILSCLTCVFIYQLAGIFFNKTAAFFSSLAVVFYPDLIFWMSFARPETLFIFLLVLGFLLLLKGNFLKNKFFLYLSAVVFGLASLTRITITPFLPFIILWQAFFFSDNKKNNIKVALCMALITGLVLLPWGMRNQIVFGKFTVLSDEAGTLVGSIENGEQYNGVEIDNDYQSHDSLILKNVVFIRDNFKVYVASCCQRFTVFWSPFTHVMRPWAKIYKGLSWFIIFPAAFLGMFLCRKNWKGGAGLLILFILYYSALYTMSLMHLNLVYRYPIQPFLCIFAGYAFYDLFKRIKGEGHELSG